MSNISKFSKENKKPKMSTKENRIYIFTQMPIWKSVLKMAIPGMIQMLIMGAYMFADSVIAVNYAEDNYVQTATDLNNLMHIQVGSSSYMHAHDLVRMFMSGASPITALMMAVTLLFSIGVATRVSINLGKGDIKRAKDALRTGMMMSAILSIVLIPVLYFAATPWMEIQYADPVIAKIMAKHAFDFAWIGIIGFPIQAFAQTVSGLFRIEGKNKEMVIASVVPILINIILDFIFLIPAGMGVEGVAWATFIANIFGSLLAIFFVIKMKSDILTFKNMYGKFLLLPIIGIVLVGLAPFLRQLAQSTTQTAEASLIQSVSKDIYNGNPMRMTELLASAMPVFMLVFPVTFAFSQSARPIASFNYGAGNMQRVRQTLKWTMLYATVASLILYALAAGALGGPLLSALGTEGETKAKSLTVLRITMVTMPLFSIAITGMTLFGSTDRVVFSVLASTLRGFILLFPVLYIFKAIAHAAPSYEFAFWWFYPMLGLLTSLSCGVMILLVLRKLEYKHTTLDERIDRINKLFETRKELFTQIRKVKKSIKDPNERVKQINELKLAEKQRYAALKATYKVQKEQAEAAFAEHLKAKKEAKLALKAARQ